MVASDVRNGMTIEYEGKVYEILEFMHVKPGKGAAFVRIKMKDVINGGVTENSYNPTTKFEKALIEKKTYQYLYKDDFYNFMDQETYDQLAIAVDEIEDSMKFVKENEEVMLKSYKGKVFSVEPPIEVTLLITACEPGVKGNTTTNATKPATLETGATVKVPLFVNEGEYIKIDTRTGEYKSRA